MKIKGYIACNPDLGNHIDNHKGAFIWDSQIMARIDLMEKDQAIRAVDENGFLHTIEEIEN